MDLRDIRYHSCPIDDNDGILLIDMETETVPEMDEDGNYVYYCNSGHVFSVEEEEDYNYYPSWRRAYQCDNTRTNAHEDTVDLEANYSEAVALASSLPPILNQLGLGTESFFNGLTMKEISKALYHPELFIRTAAAQVLERTEDIQDVFCAKLNIIARRDGASGVRAAAIRALGKLRRVDQITTFIELLNDSAWIVRAAAVEALGLLGKQAPLDVIIQTVINDPQSDVRSTGIASLSSLGKEAPLHVITSALHDQSWQVREMAALVLGKLMIEAAIPYLEEALNDSDELVRSACQQSLDRIRST